MCSFATQDFCTFCCREQITDVYGSKSKELSTFESVIKVLGGDEKDEDMDMQEDVSVPVE